MGAPHKHDDATRRWVADLVKEQGLRGGAAAAQAAGRKVGITTAGRWFREFYPSESADPAAPLDQGPGEISPAAPAPDLRREGAAPREISPPAPPPPDQEMMDAQGPEQVLELAIKRAARFTGGTEGRLVLAALDRVKAAVRELTDLRKAGQEQERRRFRIVEVWLPPKEQAP